MKCHPVSKQAPHFFFAVQLAAWQTKFFTLFICLYKLSSKARDGWKKYSFLSDIFRATFHSVLAMPGNALHTFLPHLMPMLFSLQLYTAI